MAALKKTKINKPKSLAVVDLGSNSIRLVIYQLKDRRYHPVADHKARCRLALGMKQDKPELNARGIKLALRALSNFQKIIKKSKVEHVVSIATAAVRCVPYQAGSKVS